VGTAVTIAGTDFGATQDTSSVTFNGIAVTIAAGNWSATSIVAPVPAGATSGPVVVTVGGQASNGLRFRLRRD
jgi:IPT/TIG domain-containing protein